ncbi:MAG: lytic murein transglycosylase, partial [Betaproteobacteria bacterium]|nr:lytic murein transglycosylase [Betaproteobacteria bacterium]
MIRYLAIASLALAGPSLASAEDESVVRPTFPAWLANFKQQAAGAGISKATLDATLTGLRPNDRV